MLHHPNVKARYRDRRYFIACETITTTEDLWRELAKTFGFYAVEDTIALRFDLLSHLRSIADVIICLDNFDTPWEAETADVEGVLAELAALSSVSILITARQTDLPLIAWTYPPLPPVAPLRIEDALKVWDAICHDHDLYSRKLVEAADCVPLAVALLARQARNETSSIIWARWQNEKVSLLRSYGKEHRLNSLSVSIELSLKLLDDKAAIDCLCMISLFSQGIFECDIPLWNTAFEGLVPIWKTIASLKQHSLIQVVHRLKRGSSGLRVLAPIRHHMLQCYPISDVLNCRLADIYCDVDDHGIPRRDLANTITYFETGLTRDITRERCLQTIARSDKTICHMLYPKRLLVLVVDLAKQHASSFERDL